MQHARGRTSSFLLIFVVATASCGGGGHGGGNSTPPPPVTALTSAAVTPMRLSFSAVQGGLGPISFISIATSIAGVGSSAVPWSVSGDQPWISLITPKNSAGAGSVLVGVSTQGLVSGSYFGNVVVTVQGIATPILVPVTFTITAIPPSVAVQPAGFAQPVRAPFGTTASPVSLQDQLIHVFTFPGVRGTSYSITLDTTPSGTPLVVFAGETSAGGSQPIPAQTITTPFTKTFSATVDSRIELQVYDGAQANLVLSNLTVTPTSSPYDRTGFDVVLHVTGDVPFTGLGYANDLATATDQVTFALSLRAKINAILPPSIQIRKIGIDQIPNSAVAAIEPTLIVGGYTSLPSTDQQYDNVSALGTPASDPNFGNALDVFLIHSTGPVSQDGTITLGLCSCALSQGGGTFVGNGPGTGIFEPMFVLGTPVSIDALANTLAHEIGHFLGLFHTTEQNFDFDDITDTPFTPTTNDRDGDKIMEVNEAGPDASFLMFWVRDPSLGPQGTMSLGQIKAAQDYLSIRKH